MAMSNTERANNARKARKAEGWIEVRLWVASKSDAAALKSYSEKLRMNTLEPQLRTTATNYDLTPAETDAVLAAIRAEYSDEYKSPAGAMRDLMSDLARAGRLRAMNGAFKMHELAHPSSATQVLNTMPNKIMAHYAPNQLDFRGMERFLSWKAANPEWQEVGVVAIERDDLEGWAASALKQIAATQVS